MSTLPASPGATPTTPLPPDPTSAEWRRLVRDVTDMASSAGFTLGDRLLLDLPMASSGETTGAYEAIAVLARDTDLSPKTLVRARAIAAAFPPSVREEVAASGARLSWTAWRALFERVREGERAVVLDRIKSGRLSNATGVVTETAILDEVRRGIEPEGEEVVKPLPKHGQKRINVGEQLTPAQRKQHARSEKIASRAAVAKQQIEDAQSVLAAGFDPASDRADWSADRDAVVRELLDAVGRFVAVYEGQVGPLSASAPADLPTPPLPTIDPAF